MKIDTNKVIKKASRDFFSGIDTRTRKVPAKTTYKRKPKYAKMDW